MDITSQKLSAEKLLQIKAIRLSPDNPFTWASGWKSPIYCDNRKILGFPYLRDYFKSELSNLVFSTYPDASLVAGVATAGIAWGALVADQLKLPFVYVRPKPKDHGTGNQIEGYFEPGMQAVVVEDLISTGKSSLQAVTALRAAGVEISGMVALFNYGFEEAKQAMATAQVPLHSLTNYPELISAAAAQGYIGNHHLEMLTAWAKAPDQWDGSLKK